MPEMSTLHHSCSRPPIVSGEESERLGLIRSNETSRNRPPAIAPRSSSLYHHNSINDGFHYVGVEINGKLLPSEGSASPQTPPFLRWAKNLSCLLSDPEGVELFRSYLKQEGPQHSDTLDFWFACEGLKKQTDPDRISQYVKVIFRRFFLKTQLGINESLRKLVHKRVKDESLDTSVFDGAQSEVERLITESTYPNFLRSDTYLSYVQAMQNGSISGQGSGGSSANSGNGHTLATLHEDKELDMTCQSSYPPLTKDMLMMTQKRRVDLRPKPEAFAGVFLHGKPGVRAYSSYNPVSRQDSELQSLSSDARTESDMSLTDSSVDGMSLGHHRMTRKQYQRHYRQVKESASLNREPHAHQTVIPRTQRLQKEQSHPMKPEEFAAILIERLERVRRNQEVREELEHKLSDGLALDNRAPTGSLADAIRERFQIEDDNDQDILDQHVSRVWSDQTPSRTPGVASPRPKSPDLFRRSRPPNQPANKVGGIGSGPVPYGPVHGIPHPYQGRPHIRHLRKDKDVFSTFSSDSGNVHDFSDSLEHKILLPKSKSMPEYSDTSDTYSSLPSHDSRFRGRDWCGSGRKYAMKPELTDSGVSVVSEAVSHHSNDKVYSWLMESKGVCSHSERDSASSCSGSSRFDTKHHIKSSSSRGRRSPPPCMDGGSHTPAHLEEARRRLVEEQARSKQCRQRCCTSGKAEFTHSAGSTLRKGGSVSSSTAKTPQEVQTTVVFSFCDEQFPYRSKIPGQSITLKQFKEFLPKKGNYRYFFKTECEELDMRVIQEEITDDSEILPLWEGKVMAQVKPID